MTLENSCRPVALAHYANYNPSMTTPAIAPDQIEQAIRELPPLAQQELAQFIGYLRYKYSDVEPTILALEGLWADVDLNISQEDVRQLREEVSSRLIAR